MARIRYIVPLAACAGVLVAGGVGLSGCLNGQAYAQIGIKDQNAATFELQNQTGKSVTAIKVKRADAKKYGTALSQSAPVAQDETVEVSYTPSSDKSDIRITTDDGSRYTLHNVNVADIDDAALKVDGQTAYLTYTSVKLGTEQNTLQSEKDLIAAKKKAAAAKKKAEAERKAKAKKAAAAAKKKAEAKRRAQKAKAAGGADASTSTDDQTGSLSTDAAVTTDTATTDTADATATTDPATVTEAAPAASNTGAAASAAPKQHAASSAPKSSGGNSGGNSGGGSNKASSGGGSSNAAAQKAASANGSGKEQKCTTDF